VMATLAEQGARAELVDLTEFPTQLTLAMAFDGGRRQFELRRHGGAARTGYRPRGVVAGTATISGADRGGASPSTLRAVRVSNCLSRAVSSARCLLGQCPIARRCSSAQALPACARTTDRVGDSTDSDHE